MDAYPIPSATVRSIRDGRRPRLLASVRPVRISGPDLPRDWWVDYGWYTDDAGYERRDWRPTVALLAWTHERRELHQAPAAACSSCIEYRDLYGPPPGEVDWTHCRRYLRQQPGRAERWAKSDLAQARRAEVTKAVWWEILERDDFRCRHCGARRWLTVDHIIPVDHCGSSEPDNLQTLCRSCNSKKGNR